MGPPCDTKTSFSRDGRARFTTGETPNSTVSLIYPTTPIDFAAASANDLTRFMVSHADPKQILA